MVDSVQRHCLMSSSPPLDLWHPGALFPIGLAAKLGMSFPKGQLNRSSQGELSTLCFPFAGRVVPGAPAGPGG